eukprot:scaffold283591_cov44-Prasinocladus_malaysianus.AAC.1
MKRPLIGAILNIRLRLSQDEVPESPIQESPMLYVTKPLPRVLVLHTGGTLGMDPESSYETGVDGTQLKTGTGGNYGGLNHNMRMRSIYVVFNKDSCRVGPPEWVRLAKLLDHNRNKYDAFLIVHGTDTMSYTASALSLMLLVGANIAAMAISCFTYSPVSHNKL